MSVAFKAAWMLLKQRGHELNLPEPRRQNVGPHAATMSPQDLTDARVNAASKQRHALNEIEMAGTQNRPRINSMDDAMGFLDDQKFNQREMEDQLNIAERHQAEEGHFERLQGDLDRETLARRAQQPEADEMEAMGVPEMGRTLGGTPPANIGRAGSTDKMPMGEPPNPFPKPLAGRVQDQLAEFADGAGRRAAMSPQPDYTGDEFSMNSDDFKYDDESKLEESHPEAHNIASTNLRQTPRKQKRGRMDSGEAFDRPGFRGPAMPLPGGKGD